MDDLKLYTKNDDDLKGLRSTGKIFRDEKKDAICPHLRKTHV